MFGRDGKQCHVMLQSGSCSSIVLLAHPVTARRHHRLAAVFHAASRVVLVGSVVNENPSSPVSLPGIYNHHLFWLGSDCRR